MPATLYAINASLAKDFGATNYTPPATYYVGLSTVAISASTTSGSSAAEPGGGAYARVAYTNNAAGWTTPIGGSCVSTGSFAFPQSSTAWGTIVSVFLADAATIGTGTIWFYHNLTPSVPVVANTVLTFAAGTLSATRT